jgi:tetratricopeptide (TPR) repeat protein
VNDRLATGQRIEADRQRCQSLLSILDAVKRDPSADAARIALDALNELSGMGDVPSAEVTERLLSVARERYYTNDTTSAVRASSLALRLARQLGDHSLRRKTLTIHGAICRSRGDDAAAVEAYVEAIDAARLASDTAQEAPVWNNVGIVLHNRGQSAEALHCFAKAAEARRR